ncbi:DUF4093 domain-containing protein [Enterococcus gallinarum]|nr:DUF4093 domain-containing protein [Enterococcus gallinarum]
MEALREALRKAVTPASQQDEDERRKFRQVFSKLWTDCWVTSTSKTGKLEMFYESGYTNAKQLKKRLAMFRITETELAKQ